MIHLEVTAARAAVLLMQRQMSLEAQKVQKAQMPYPAERLQNKEKAERWPRSCCSVFADSGFCKIPVRSVQVIDIGSGFVYNESVFFAGQGRRALDIRRDVWYQLERMWME